MLRFIQRLLAQIQGETLRLLILAGIVLLVWGVFSPIGTLVWWLQQDIESLGLKQRRLQTALPDGNPNSSEADLLTCYIIFLTGVGDFSANQLAPGEERFLEQLEAQHTDCVVVSDVFPYSAANESLEGRRLLAPLWRFAEQARGWLENASVLIKIRNLWRFAISIDRRYSPVYNFGTATAIVDRMDAAQPIPNGSQQPLRLILIGTSGGAQVALGAADYLEQWLNAELTVVSVGGVFSGTNGFDVVDRVYHLQGEADWIENLSYILFPSCWPWVVGSPFNQARRQGRFWVYDTGPHAHDGATGYFGQAPLDHGDRLYVDLTLNVVNQLPIWSEPAPSD
ncbi:hypothetical protein IQ268_19845 [Oculatella sp. LEGE 06141]|uniref:hypothetical protein n=1 Tax=Oculatella sp. LEGE 06141 TaxID=1828648 RepID=UPI00188073D7|nr:hypothetical protein [Oculatella sp. LEGE 06141]